MGDLRNRIAKQMRDAQHRAWLAEHCPEAKPAPPLKCRCGYDHFQRQIVGVTEDRWRPLDVYCRDCAPPDIAALVWPDQP